MKVHLKFKSLQCITNAVSTLAVLQACDFLYPAAWIQI